MSGHVRTTLGVLLSLLLLWWALRDVSFSEVMLRVRRADMLLFALSITVAVAGFPFRAWRWGVMLQPVAPDLPFGPRLAATFIGFATNNLLPARVGEFARAYSLARLSSIPTPAAFAGLVIERLLDGLILVGLLFVVMAAPDFPAATELAGIDVRSGIIALALVMWGVIVGLVLVVAVPRKAAQAAYLLTRLLPQRLRPAAIDVLRSFARGLAVLRSPRLFILSGLLTLAQWLFLGTSFLLGFRAFEIHDVPYTGALFLQTLTGLAVAIPSSPGFFGPFEASVRLGLGLWNVSAEQAISFAIGYHIAGFLPVTLIGVYYVWRTNLTWSEVRHSEEVVEEELEGHREEDLAPRPQP